MKRNPCRRPWRDSYTWRYRLDSPWATGMLGGLGLAFFDRSTFPESVRNVTGTLSWDIEFGYMAEYGPWMGKIYTGGMFSDAKNDEDTRDKRRLTDNIVAGLQCRTGERDRWYPAPFVDVKYSKFRILDDPVEYHKNGFGVGAGVMLEGRFERLSYSYNTNVGGYHRIDFLAALGAGPRSKAGTMYSFYYGDDLRLFRIRYYFEVTTRGYHEMEYNDDRSFIQKSLAAGIFAPVYWLVKILDFAMS